MWWFNRRRHPDQEASQRQAQRAIEFSELQQEIINELAPEIARKMTLLDRLNRENNFGPKLEAAYAQRRP